MASKHKHPIYKLYREQPPVNSDGTPHLGGLHRVAYWDGFNGNPHKYVPGSAAWWAMKAGRDNRKDENKKKEQK